MSWKNNVISENKNPTQEPPKIIKPQTQSVNNIQSQNTTTDDNEFIDSNIKIVKTITIYGEKGVGKTYNSLSFLKDNESAFIFSFDEQSRIIAEEYFKDKKIEVYDAIVNPRFVLKRIGDELKSEESVENSHKNIQLLYNKILSIKDGEYDFIIVDGGNILEKMCEGEMRYLNNIKSYNERFPNLSLWNDRNSATGEIFNLCKQKAKKALIYTVYPMKNIMKKVEGEDYEFNEQPEWSKEIKHKTNITLRIKADDYIDKNGGNLRNYFVLVDNSKYKNIKSGQRINITNKLLKDVFDL